MIFIFLKRFIYTIIAAGVASAALGAIAYYSDRKFPIMLVATYTFALIFTTLIISIAILTVYTRSTISNINYYMLSALNAVAASVLGYIIASKIFPSAEFAMFASASVGVAALVTAGLYGALCRWS
jgi:hypothetical protein